MINDLLQLVGRKRGMLISGGEINTERAAITVLDEFRGGKLGRHYTGTSSGGIEMTLLEFDRNLYCPCLCGVDEAGTRTACRGCVCRRGDLASRLSAGRFE